jgi:hypothetical protein
VGAATRLTPVSLPDPLPDPRHSGRDRPGQALPLGRLLAADRGAGAADPLDRVDRGRRRCPPRLLAPLALLSFVVPAAPPHPVRDGQEGAARGVPDIVYNAGIYTGVPGEWKGVQFCRFGGTSAGSPQWAAITAIIDQKAGHDLGQINPALYRLGDATDAQYCAACFQDITTGNNTVHETNADGTVANITGYNAGGGWDATTGIGSPNVANLSAALPNAVQAQDTQAVIASTAQTKFNNGRLTSVGNRPH